MRTLNLAQYARETGGTTDADVQGHIHAGLRSCKQTKAHVRFYDRRYAELSAKRDATTAAYRAAVAAGEIAEPAEATLEEIATGIGEAAAAARRLIAKRDARRSTSAPPKETP